METYTIDLSSIDLDDGFEKLKKELLDIFKDKSTMISYINSKINIGELLYCMFVQTKYITDIKLNFIGDISYQRRSYVFNYKNGKFHSKYPKGLRMDINRLVSESDEELELFPILNSTGGDIWTDGKYPLPEGEEGTLLLLKYKDDEMIHCALFRNGDWAVPLPRKDGFFEWEYPSNHLLSHWKWISAPTV